MFEGWDGMKFDVKFESWVDEIQNYLTESSAKIGKLKRVLSEVDFSNLDYSTKTILTTMFNPTNDISEKLFKRQVDLYFSLLENKPKPISVPIFSDYMDWIYSKNISTLPDELFEILATRVMKSDAAVLTPAINSFVEKLPKEFDRDIDKISNHRLNTLVGVLKNLDDDYENLPKECQDFVKRLFISCAVKTEIADKNKQKFRNLFKDDPKKYYTMFNRAFAGVGANEAWIDEPAKKLTFTNMVNYANFQSRVLEKSMYNLNYYDLEKSAKELSLPKLPPYEKRFAGFDNTYLKEAREYKTYAKKMGNLFVGLVRNEVAEIERLGVGEKFPKEKLYEFAITNDMKRKAGLVSSPVISEKSLKNYADFLVWLVHLDELTGQSAKDIYDSTHKQSLKNENTMPQRNVNFDKNAKSQNAQDKFCVGELQVDRGVFDRIKKNCCGVQDLSDLYIIYNDLLKRGERDLALENMIFDLQVMANELTQKDEQEKY